ncbi:uncharacterized protein [Antedon mediterranea]|uniref:uncharacterized protein n=1 Tax=Antedon mediterranea TaxID=105859 RepID=UPI003AF8C6C3
MAELSYTLNISLWTFRIWIILNTVCAFKVTSSLKLTPVDPYSLAGSTLNFTCTLDQTKTWYNASDIEWKVDEVPINSGKNTAVISSTEAILTLKNLNMTGHEHWIDCFLLNLVEKQNGRVTTYKSTSSLTVGIVPSSPTLNCRSTNIVDYLCTWGTEFTGVISVYTFQFQNSSNVWIDCSNKLNDSTCKVSESDGNPMRAHLVRVVVENMFGTANTTSTFDSKNEAVPLSPLIDRVSVGESNVIVFWKLQEDCYYCNSLWFQLRYRRLNETWTEEIEKQHKKQNIIEEITTAVAEYEFQVRSRFSLGLHHQFSDWSPIVTLPISMIIDVNATSSENENVLSLQWETPNDETQYLYRITGTYTRQSLNESVEEELTLNNIDINVPCNNITENTIVYNLELRSVQADTFEVEVEGPPTRILYEFKCLKQGLVTERQPVTLNTVAVQYEPDEFIIPFLVVGIIILFVMLFFGAFNVYIRKRIFIEWPEPKFFKVEISPVRPRLVEKEVFDDLKTKKSDLPTSYRSSTSSDQGFHEFIPDSQIEEKNIYMVVPSIDQVSPVTKSGFINSSPVTTDKMEVKEGSTAYFRLQQTGEDDALQLSPLLVESTRNVQDSNPYTPMTSVSSDKPLKSGKCGEENVTDPYWKLDEVLRVKVDSDTHAGLMEFIPVSTCDYYSREEDIGNFIGEDEIDNLLNGMPQTNVELFEDGHLIF